MNLYRCYMWCDAGCEFCEAVERRILADVEAMPWPSETWNDLTDSDIDRLIADAHLELDRRYIRAMELERLWEL